MKYSVSINNKKYICTNLVKDDEKIRKSFNTLSQKVFGLSFETWYKNGYWQNNYIPHVLIHDGEVVANISVNIMKMNYSGVDKNYIQLGTVMTNMAYRNQGLSQYLMNIILDEFSEKSDEIFLFANDSVLEFYPKFGFNRIDEYQYYRPSTELSVHKARKLNMSDENDVRFLRQMACYGNPYSEFQMTDIDGMLMFYCSQFMQDGVYYSEEFNTIIIAEINDGTILCYDVFGNNNDSLCDVIATISENTSIKIDLGFTPKKLDGFEMKVLKEENTTLFMLNKKENLFKQSNLMFSLLSHA